MQKFCATLLVFIALCCYTLYTSASNLNQNSEPTGGAEVVESQSLINTDLGNSYNSGNLVNSADVELQEGTEKTRFNALKIVVNRNGEETEHFIAVDGNNLTLRAEDNVIVLSNSKFGVKYEIDEISHFIPMLYEFKDDEYFIGGQDISTSIKASHEIPLTLSMEGDEITVKGIVTDQGVKLYTVSGMLIASSRVENGVATFRVSSLDRGIYLLNVDRKSIKVLIGR